MVNMDLDRLTRFHRKKKSSCTLVLHPNNHPSDSDLVEVNAEGRVTALHPKPHKDLIYYRNLVNAGVYVFSPDILPFLEKGKKADFGRDVFPRIFTDLGMYGYITSEYLKDMGTLERWKEVNEDYRTGKVFQQSLENKQKAIFLDRDGVLNIEKSFIIKPEDLVLYDFVTYSMHQINSSEYLAIVITNQSVIARNLCTIDELETIHKKLETGLGAEKAYLDAIYYCPHHPDKGYPEERPEYKIDCDCRKPKPGLFLKASRNFNIDLSESWMIGDSERDVLAGKNAGCKTVGVMTGYGTAKTGVRPDFLFTDLAEAVGFILDDPYAEEFSMIKIRADSLNKRPVIIAVAGNSRSGKSNFVSYLDIRFRKSGYSVLKIGLDNWILPEKVRKDCRDVYDRFNPGIIEKDLKRLLKGETVDLKSYANHPHRKSQRLIYEFNQEDIVILDGVVALGLYEVRQLADIKIFMDIDEKLLRHRIEQYYTWRQKEKNEIEELFQKRRGDEYQLIEKDRKFADFVINAS